MKDQKKAITDWNKCVIQAKKILRRDVNGFEMIKGKLLKTAQKIYCSLGY